MELICKIAGYIWEVSEKNCNFLLMTCLAIVPLHANYYYIYAKK
jgi:hypothetical protein